MPDAGPSARASRVPEFWDPMRQPVRRTCGTLWWLTAWTRGLALKNVTGRRDDAEAGLRSFIRMSYYDKAWVPYIRQTAFAKLNSNSRSLVAGVNE